MERDILNGSLRESSAGEGGETVFCAEKLDRLKVSLENTFAKKYLNDVADSQ